VTRAGARSADDVVVRRAGIGEILALRHAVLRAGMPLGAAHFDGDDESATLHVGAFLPDGRVVGCASAMRRPFEATAEATAAVTPVAGAYQLRGMATRPDLAGRGVGLRVLRAVESGCATGFLWCNARVPAVEFYRRAGWTVVSDVFEIPTAGPHRRMTKNLTTASRLP